VAWLIDVAIIAVLSIVLGTAVMAALVPVAGPGSGGQLIFLLLFVTLLPFTLANLLVTVVYALPPMCREGARNGQTLGKQLLGLRVERFDGAPISMSTAVLREVVWRNLIIGFGGVLTLFVVVILDYLWPLWDGRGQSLHDKGARTRVVRAG
jgi:uncharacterized RDD family membrane protein YckC